ncbi:hypothetical protein GGR58DRAFT_529261 [Xylaria digitata]|nr:hypothetical protein GGR58DRAFT_529261 [Xylaria digitata]
MDYSFDGHGLSREQLQAKAEAAALTGQLDGQASYRRAVKPKDACEWQGDTHEPELDDLAEACKKNQQSTGLADTCDWRGDKPEQHEDDLGQSCQSGIQPQQSGQRDKPVEEADDIQMPIPRPAKVSELPEIIFPLANEEAPTRQQDPEPPLENLAREEKQSESGNKPKKKKKVQPGSAAGPSNAPPKDGEAEDESLAEGKTHSPWVDSLENMPATVMEKVNLGIKHTLDAATRALTPSAQKQSQSPEPTAGPPPPNLHVSSPPRHSTELPPGNGVRGSNKKQRRERKRSEKKARREAKRRARQEKIRQRETMRREAKERREKEKAWKKAAQKGSELPVHILQGLRIAPGVKVPHNPSCDICKKSAASVVSNKKRDPKCTTCVKAAEREASHQYLKSSNINLADLPSLDDLLDTIKKLIGKEKKSGGQTPSSDQGREEEELAQHILLHIQDLATNGGEANLRGHKCKDKGQSGRHGLDGNRDSPPSTEGGRKTSLSSRRNSEVDWWVKAMSSKESPSSPYLAISPRTFTPLPR